MVSKEDVESFLARLASSTGANVTEHGPALWIIRPGGEMEINVALSYAPPVLVMRVEVMDLPTEDGQMATLSRRLLELNATDLLHGSYGIQDEKIVLTEALELSALDYEEFLASYESITFALASHLRELGSFREAR